MPTKTSILGLFRHLLRPWEEAISAELGWRNAPTTATIPVMPAVVAPEAPRATIAAGVGPAVDPPQAPVIVAVAKKKAAPKRTPKAKAMPAAARATKPRRKAAKRAA